MFCENIKKLTYRFLLEASVYSTGDSEKEENTKRLEAPLMGFLTPIAEYALRDDMHNDTSTEQLGVVVEGCGKDTR
jgi:hypothetical protein